MAVEETRRIALHRAAAASWGEEVADTLVELVTPAGHEPATRADIHGVLAAMNAMDQRWDARFTSGLEGLEHRLSAAFERSIREAITSQTRSMLLALVVVTVTIAALAFGVGG